jgi:hypothetical protein
MSHSPVLSMLDPQALKYTVEADASGQSSGACLYQTSRDGTTRIVAYYSKMFSPEERRYCTTRKEMTAIVRALRHWRPYLVGRKVHVKSDHSSLQYLLKCKHLPPQWGRYLDLLSEFDLEIQYVPGREQKISDYLSRFAVRPCENSADEPCPQCRTREERLNIGSSVRGRQCRDRLESDRQLAANRRVACNSRRLAGSQQEDVALSPVHDIKISNEPLNNQAERENSPPLTEQSTAGGMIFSSNLPPGVIGRNALSGAAVDRCVGGKGQTSTVITDDGARDPLLADRYDAAVDEPVGTSAQMNDTIIFESVAGDAAFAEPQTPPRVTTAFETAQSTLQSMDHDIGAADARRVTTRAQSQVAT